MIIPHPGLRHAKFYATATDEEDHQRMIYRMKRIVNDHPSRTQGCVMLNFTLPQQMKKIING